MGDLYLQYFYSDEEEEEEESQGEEIDENQEEDESQKEKEKESLKELENEGDENQTEENEEEQEEKQHDNRREKQTSQILSKKAAQVRSSNKFGLRPRKRHAPHSKPDKYHAINEKDSDSDDTVQRTRSSVKTRTLSRLQDKQQEDRDTEPMKEQPWTSFEIKHLRQAVIFIPEDHPEFWDLVQQMVVTKTKEECQEQHRKDVAAGEQINLSQASTADLEYDNQGFFGSKGGPASESPKETVQDTDEVIDSGAGDDENTLVDQDSVTGKSPSKRKSSSKQKKRKSFLHQRKYSSKRLEKRRQSRRDLMTARTLTDEKRRIVHNGKLSRRNPDHINKTQNSPKPLEKRKQSRRDLMTALTLTDEERPIVHNGKLSSRNPDDIEKIREKGISIRGGKWLPLEDEILVENFERLKSCSLIDIDNSSLLRLLFPNLMGTQKEQDNVKAYLKGSFFNIRLAGNLRRLPESVLDRAKRILPTWKTGPFTAKEEETLLNLHKIHGNQWTLIGYHLNRSRNSVLDHYRIIENAHRKKGPWTEDESNTLRQVISEVMETDDLLSLPHYNLPWKQIGKKMQHRSGKQCRSHWTYQLRPKFVQGGSHVKPVNKNQLRAELCSLDVKTESEIDWVDLLEKMPKAGTPQQLRQQWQGLRSNIAGVDRMTFDEIKEVLSGTI